jgi:hypothetical protein
MLRKLLSARRAIPIILCVQVIPLLIFPPSAYTIRNQVWWLPVILTVLVIIALVQLLGRKSQAAWPWYLLSFANGFNIISRLMMLMPHSTINVEGTQYLDAAYVLIAAASMLFSSFEIWYAELPEVRNRLLNA